MEDRSEEIFKNWPEAMRPPLQFGAVVHRLSTLLQEDARRVFRRHDLTFAEFDVLANLRTRPRGAAPRPTEIFNTLLISSGGLTKILKSLEKQYLITRPESKSDARERLVQLTDKGQSLAEQVIEELAQSQRLFLQSAFASDDECLAACNNLKHILDAIERPE